MSGRSVARYKTGYLYTDSIEVVELVRETAKTVTVREPDAEAGFCEACYHKDSRHCQLFETWELARAFLMARALNAIEQKEGEILHLQSRLASIKAMKPARLQ